MFRKRTPLVTTTYLAALSKSIRSDYSSNFNTLYFSSRSSTAAAERFDFQNQVHGDNLVDYEQNVYGFRGANPNPNVFQHNNIGYSQDQRIRGNVEGYQRNPRADFPQNPPIKDLNFRGGYGGESGRNEFHGKSVQQSGSMYSKSDAGLNQNSMFQNGNSGDNYRGSSRIPDGSYREVQPAVQQNHNGAYGHTLGFPKTVNGSYGGNVGQYQPPGYLATSQHKRNDSQFGQPGYNGASVYKPNDHQFQQPGYASQHEQQFRQPVYAGTSQQVPRNQQFQQPRYAGTSEQKPNSYLIGDMRTIQHSPDNYYSASTSTSQSDADNWGKNRTHLQSPNAGNPYLEKSGIPQHNTSNTCEENSGITQGSHGNYLGGSREINYQQSVNGYNRVRSALAMPSSGEISHNHNGSSYNGDFQNISNHRTAVMDSEESGDSTIQTKPVEVTADQYRSTVDNLDEFFVEGRLTEEVLELLESPNIPVDLPRHYILIKACEKAKTREEANNVHEHIVRVVSSPEVAIYNKLLDMYGRCSSMVDAFAVFDAMPQHNLTSWDTMITWLAKCGHGEDAIELFTQFKESGLKPDGPMFVGVLSACGVLEDMFEGMSHFESMTKDHGIVPSMEHYVSVVDMLGTSGYLDEAVEFIEKMPMEPSVDVWEALMNLARVHGNVDLGDRCAEMIELIEPARLSEQSKAGLIPAKASDIAKEKERKKLASQNLLASRSRINEYRAGDTSSPDTDRIYALLRGMKQQMKEVGYVPETRVVLHDIDPESKEEALLSHSERLALANGLLNTPVRSQIRIIKNLRVCVDCHNALKIMSKLVGREIVARDAKRFHHFKDGLCSCRDYW